MVFIEEKWNYLKQLDKDNLIHSIDSLFYNKELSKPDKDAKFEWKLSYGLVKNDKSIFEEEYKAFSERQPNEESEFIYQDIRLFLLICVVKKFNLEKDWLIRFLNLRRKNNLQTSNITQSFLNILNDNLENKEGNNEIIIVYKKLFEIPQNNDLLDEIYLMLSQKKFPFYENNLFLNFFAIKTLDIITLSKGLEDGDNYKRLKKFEGRFDKISWRVGMFVYVLLMIGILAISSFVTYYLFFGSKSKSELADKIFTAFAQIGFIAILNIFFPKQRNQFIKGLQKLLWWFYGYKKKE